MEKIIAKEIAPQGIESDIFSYLEKSATELSLEDSVVYYGFPVFKDYEDSAVKSKFAILSKWHGLILLYTSDQHSILEDDEHLEQLFSYIDSAIRKSKLLRIGKRKLALNLESLIYCLSQDQDIPDLESEVISSLAELNSTIQDLKLDEPLTEEILFEVRSILEGAKALSASTKRTKVSDDPKSKLNVLIELEKEILNFDIEQRKIAISLINGPQRIRGLAGSGKTVVLAMKAAHIHLQYPEKKILFTFYTKSLYGLIREMIAKFYRHFAGSEPDWDCIHVLHSWGGQYVDGVYYNACMDNHFNSIAFTEAKAVRPSDPFAEVCSKAVEKNISSKYDYILIDEAQDLPNEFFQLCFELANGESGGGKNIVWAYDELQSIFKVYQRTPAELFGLDDSGKPKIDLIRQSETLTLGQSNDLVLYKCYRNPLEVLLTAHALGFAVYSEKPVQMLENKEHWEDVGYKIEENSTLKVGQKVRISRPQANSPLSIKNYANKDDLILCNSFDNIGKEAEWVASQIRQAIDEGLRPDDILVISMDDRYAKSYFSKLSLYLAKYDIRSNNLLASSAAAPPFKLENMVTLSTVHRAKGNEAALVFAIGIDALYPQRQFRSGRNKIFTAFTRTKAWLRVSGCGTKADYFFKEINKSLKLSPELYFMVPSKEEIETIQRDLERKRPELVAIQRLVEELRDQGYTDSQIQMELNLQGENEKNDG